MAAIKLNVGSLSIYNKNNITFKKITEQQWITDKLLEKIMAKNIDLRE